MKGLANLALFALLALGACTQTEEPAPSASAAATERNRILLSERAPPPELAEGAELLVVSGKEAGRTGDGPRVKVSVDRPGKKVLLVLASRTRVAWEVAPGPGTQMVGVLASSGHGSTVQMVDPAPGFVLSLPVPEEAGTSEWKELLARLNALFGITRIDLARAQRELPRNLALGQLDPPRAELAYQAPPERGVAQFELLDTGFRPVRWRFDGPLQEAKVSYVTEGKVVLAPGGGTIYQVSGDKLVITDRRTRAQRIAALPGNFPPFSWAMDVAYDSKRNYVTVITLGGEGHIYRFDAVAQAWVDVRSVNNIDIGSLSYEPKGDRYLAWTTDHEFMVIAGDGGPVRSFSITSDLSGFNRIVGEERGNEHAVTLAGAGDEIAIVAFEKKDKSVKAVWRYNLATGAAKKTF
jgi:hypothetical protein